MMSENNPDVIKELVAHRQARIRNAVMQSQGRGAPHALRSTVGRFIIRMGESVRGPEMNPRTADSRPTMPAPSMRGMRQA